MTLPKLSLQFPYTVAAVVILLASLGLLATTRMPTDIFPEINIPVVSVVWTYSGMPATDIQNRVITIHERQLASLVDDIQRVESSSYTGVGVIKVYLNEGADVSRAVSQLSSSAQVALKLMPPGITPPLVLRYSATDVSIIQLALSSKDLPDSTLNDLGQNLIRPALAVVQGAQVPYPFGGKPRVIMADLDSAAMQARGVSPADVTDAVKNQNLIVPAGTVKIGDREFPVQLNNSTETVAAMNDFPIKQIGSTTIFLRDVANVRDGYLVQTNSVSNDGRPGSLMVIRKTGGASTLSIIDGIKAALPDIQNLMPKGVAIKTLFDQSIFVKAAMDSVFMGGAIAAALTALMILLFLGNARLTLIILLSIPLSILFALIGLYATGESLNTMTLGGFALAVGILVDNATVVIENIERNLHSGKALEAAIIEGAAEIQTPTGISTLAICIVFVPIFLLQGTAKYLFSPLALSVILSLLSSLVLSFTLVPVLFRKLLASSVHNAPAHGTSSEHSAARASWPARAKNFLLNIHYIFEEGFEAFREHYKGAVAFAVASPAFTCAGFGVLMLISFSLFPALGRDFFPQVDAGQMRLHVRAPAGTKIEKTQLIFGEVEEQIRQILGKAQIDVMLDNIGLPYSGINIALSDTATVGPMDGEILISLAKKHRPTAEGIAALRRELPRAFPADQFFFQPADIVNQVLNFGQPAPIDVRVIGPHLGKDEETAAILLRDLGKIPGLVDAHIFQVNDAPALKMDVDRALAANAGLTQHDVASSVLVSLGSSTMLSPNFWLNPKNNVSYPLVLQSPQYQIDSMSALDTLPITGDNGKNSQLLMNLASVTRTTQPLIATHVNIQPSFDVHADVQGQDLATVASAIEKVISNDTPDAKLGVKVSLTGQVKTMQDSFSGLAGGMVLAVFLVYLLMVANFQSWLDPAIVLAAVPLSLSGVIWALFGSHTHLSVPALMGTLMCIGLTTANSVLVVSFARQRLAAGDNSIQAALDAGATRLRPVLMTAGAMILGMIPMALGIGEGGEQNAPLARAVIGGLLFATCATLLLVPALFAFLRRVQSQPVNQ